MHKEYNKPYEFTEEYQDSQGNKRKWTKKFSVKVKVESFYITYIDNLSGYFKLTSGADKSVLAYLCTKAEYDTGRAAISADERVKACKMIGISSQQFTNSVARLKELKLVTGRSGFYMINPAVFWKGNSKTRSKLLNDNNLAVQFDFEVDDTPISPNSNFENETE
jgi:hypothetical protein